MKKFIIGQYILLIIFIVIGIIAIVTGLTSCTSKEDTPPPCYECYHKAYLDSTTLVAYPRYFRCDDDIEAYEAEHTGWDGNYYMVMECEK